MSKITELVVKMKDLSLKRDEIGKRLLELVKEAEKLVEKDKVIQEETRVLQAESLAELAKKNPHAAEWMSKQFGVPLKPEPEVKSILNKEDEKKINVC
jgi:hypothetical protein